MRLIFWLLIAVLASVLRSGPSLAAMIEETVDVPVEVTNPDGRPLSQTVKVTIFRDDQTPRAPFLILNHGRSSDAAIRQRVSARPFADNARYLVSRGFAVFVPIRIGYGATGGPDVESSGPCRDRRYREVYDAGVRQVLAVIAYAKSQAYVDPERGLVAGQSFGGTMAIGLAAEGVPGVRAAVNFAGGGGGRPKTHPGQPCDPDKLQALFAHYGGQARIPTLWVYSENDQYWGPELPRKWHSAFTTAGGEGRFVQIPAFKADGHSSFTGQPQAWKPAFEAFLAACCGTATAQTKEPALIRVAAPAAAPGGPAAAGSSGADASTPLGQMLSAWAQKHGIARAALVVRREGRVVHMSGYGGADPARPVHLASLSKAITGACVATLVRDGKLGYEWPVSRAMPRFLATHGRPKDPRVEGLTIGQLLTHRGGFPGGKDGGDPATRSALEAYLATSSSREAPKPALIASLLATPLVRAPGEAYAYSNVGYLMLGAIIEEASGRSYESTCRDAVLRPAGVDGTLDPVWAVLGATGGWHMAGADYLAFLDRLEPRRAAFGPATRDWMLDSAGKTVGANPRNWYSIGLRMRDTGRGIEIFHTGSWRRRFPPDAQGPRATETGTLAVRLPDGTSFFLYLTPLARGAREELFRELRRTLPTGRL
jgi:CubicO group peptidase (beta-lactamase class C family)